MKLTAKVNGVQQEIELSKEDVYVVECGGVDETNSILKFIDESFKTTFYWKFVSNRPVFLDEGRYSKHVTNGEPIPPNTPIISFEDWERLMESDKEEKAPTKWRFKTQKEFDDTCEKDKDGNYRCGNNTFATSMFYLFGEEYNGSPDNLIRHDGWNITPEMLMPLEEPNYMIPNDPNWGKVKLANSINSETKNYAFPVAPTQKWEKLTRGGNEYHIYEEFGNFIWGRIKHLDTWKLVLWLRDGKYSASGKSTYDLIPLNRESILKEIEEHENKIKELKEKL